MTERRAITLADVASEANVHAATVSRALSRPDLVNATTLERVNDAIDRLGYVPNRAARQLAGGRTATLAMLVPDITNPFFSVIVQSAQQRAREADHLVVLADTGQQPQTEVAAIRSLAPHVDGVILCSPVARPAEVRRAAGERPVVFVNRRAAGFASVVLDQRRVVALAVEHLRELGHERIAALRGPAGYWSSRQREAAIERLPDLVALGPTEPTFEGGRGALDAVLSADVTAVAAFNDVMAIGLVAEAASRSISLPAELSIVGSDDVALASMATPALTTVAAPLDELAAIAVATVLELVGGGAPGEHSVQPHLVVRASTAGPR